MSFKKGNMDGTEIHIEVYIKTNMIWLINYKWTYPQKQNSYKIVKISHGYGGVRVEDELEEW